MQGNGMEGDDSEGQALPLADLEPTNVDEVTRALKKEPEFLASITQRCRHRMEWARGLVSDGAGGLKLNIGEKDKIWVCANPDCEDKVCAEYHGLLKRWRNIEAIKRELEISAEALRESEREVGDASSTRPRKVHDLLQSIVDKDKEIVKDKQSLVEYTCRIISARHEHQKSQLGFGMSAGNQSTHVTHFTGATEIMNELNDLDRETQATMKGRAQSPTIMHEKMTPQVDLLSDEDKNVQEAIKEFYNFLDNGFRESEAVQATGLGKSTEVSSDIRNTVDVILAWKPRADNQKIDCHPSVMAQEVGAALPVLFAIISKIATICKKDTYVTREQFLPSQKEKSRRYMDGMQRSLPMSLLGKPIEIKPLCHGHKSYNDLLKAGRRQVFSHLYEKLWDGSFQFCNGLGRDGKASGMVLTMASIEVLQVQLNKVGTDEANSTSSTTGNLPLFSNDTTKTLFTEARIDTLPQDPRLRHAGESGTMAGGFKALVEFVLEGMKDDCFDGIKSIGQFKEPNNSDIEICKHLGTGAFSTVFRARKQSMDLVFKIGKSNRQSQIGLEEELAALNDLSKRVLEGIPKLHAQSLAEVTVKQRCEQSTVVGLLLEMEEGETARDYCRRAPEKEKPSIVASILTKTVKLLASVHAAKWFHLDIQPSNLLVIRPEDENSRDFKIVLIDWGCAKQKTKKMIRGFRGTAPFAHRNLFRHRPESGNTKETNKSQITWHPTAEHDNYSLAMTICYLLHGSVPWNGFNGNSVTENDLEKRDTIARELIGDSQMQDEAKRMWESLVPINTEGATAQELPSAQSGVETRRVSRAEVPRCREPDLSESRPKKRSRGSKATPKKRRSRGRTATPKKRSSRGRTATPRDAKSGVETRSTSST